MIMQYKDEQGNIVPQSTMVKNIDLQENNKLLKRAIIVFGILGIWALTLITWIIWKVISSGAVNNYIARCVC